MPFTSASPEAKKLLRNAWVAYGNAKYDEACGYVREALEKDPEFGMAHAFIYTGENTARERNLNKTSGCQYLPSFRPLSPGAMKENDWYDCTNLFICTSVIPPTTLLETRKRPQVRSELAHSCTSKDLNWKKGDL